MDRQYEVIENKVEIDELKETYFNFINGKYFKKH